MSHIEPPLSGEDKPWWNDGDKVGGIAATVVILGLALLVFVICVRLAAWIWP